MKNLIGLFLSLAFLAVTLTCCEVVSAPTPTPMPPTATPVSPTPTLAPPTLLPTSDCIGSETAEIIWPHLDEVQPVQVAPTGEIKVIGSGGYLRCGEGYNESARQFQLYFDEQSTDSIVCYVNHCEITLKVPAEALPGMHIISVEGGSSISLEVTGN